MADAPDLTRAAVALRDIHDQIVHDLGGSAYASISATWTDDSGKLRTLIYSSTEADDDEGFEDPEDVAGEVDDE